MGLHSRQSSARPRETYLSHRFKPFKTSSPSHKRRLSDTPHSPQSKRPGRDPSHSPTYEEQIDEGSESDGYDDSYEGECSDEEHEAPRRERHRYSYAPKSPSRKSFVVELQISLTYRRESLYGGIIPGLMASLKKVVLHPQKEEKHFGLSSEKLTRCKRTTDASMSLLNNSRSIHTIRRHLLTG